MTEENRIFAWKYQLDQPENAVPSDYARVIKALLKDLKTTAKIVEGVFESGGTPQGGERNCDLHIASIPEMQYRDSRKHPNQAQGAGPNFGKAYESLHKNILGPETRELIVNGSHYIVCHESAVSRAYRQYANKPARDYSLT